MKEIWKPIEGYEGLYEISNLGRVKRLKRTIEQTNKWGKFKRTLPELILNPPLQYGYPRVGLWKDGKPVSHVVHRLVAIHFLPNPENKPVINHIDANKENNRVDNLEWCTQQENIDHSWKEGLQNPRKGEAHENSKLTRNDVLDIRNAYRLGCFPMSCISEAYGVTVSHVCNIINRKVWKHI